MNRSPSAIKTQCRGFSLLEIIIFIAVLGVAGIGLLIPFGTILTETHKVDEQTRAIALAQYGMARAQGDKRLKGFSSLTNTAGSVSCPPPSGCTFGNNTLVVTVTSGWLGNPNYKVITSTVSGGGSATITSVVADY